ncbi:hypothetical protein HY488_00640 [Candidatus Woesearchaeota archaeon]|nr:hypothetical protein [Candidatus Woesearchaeota archaeon]
MLVKLLGIMDLAAVIIVLLSPALPTKIVLYVAAFIVMKGLFFGITRSIMNILDIVCGILIILMAFKITSLAIIIIVTVFLLQKAFFSIIA